MERADILAHGSRFVRSAGGCGRVDIVSAPAGRSALQAVQRWVAAHPAEDHGAARAGMSPRHFARLFRAETGLTPAAYVETVRIGVGHHLLETGASDLKQVAGACGFRDAGTLEPHIESHQDQPAVLGDLLPVELHVRNLTFADHAWS